MTLISNKDHFLYYPALYATATGHSHIQSITPLSDVFSRYPRVKVVIDEVTGIDLQRKHIVGKSGSHYDYDSAIFALGVVTNYFGIKGLDKFSYSIKSKAEVKRFKQHLHQTLANERHLDRHYIVIGGGPTGVELSAALATYLKKIAVTHKIRHSKIRLSLIEAAPRLLPRMSKATSAAAKARLEELGVTVKLNSMVERQDDDELTVNGRSIVTHTVVWTSGVSNHPFFQEHTDIFPLAKNGRVEVDQHLMAASNIYVIGDNANTPYTGLAQTALHDAQFVAQVLKKRASRQQPPQYRAVKPPVVIPVGHKWALFEWGPLHFAGRLGSLLRRAADAIGYHDILPIGHAIEAWKAEDIPEEDCDTCRLYPLEQN